MDRVLVTGGAGFVGSRLAFAVQDAYPDTTVVALDNLKRRGSELNLPRLRERGIPFVHGDIRQPGDIAAVGPVDLILECSAEPSVLAGRGQAPDYVLDTNLTGTIHCLEHARVCEAAMIFVSTSRVYPFTALETLRYDETDTRFEPAAEQAVPGVSREGLTEAFPLEGARSLYGATKLCSELLIAEYAEAYGLRAVINRCGVLTGPWQMGKIDQGIAVLWAARHLFEGRLAYIGYGGRGKQVRDMLHIDDFARLVLYEIAHLDDLAGGTYNVGGGRERSASLCELTALCQRLTGREIPMGSDPETRPADCPWYVTDNANITAATGWAPKRSLEATFDDIVRWIRDHEDALKNILG